jgi:sarcosine/dimethylglycine N-methyltransferase
VSEARPASLGGANDEVAAVAEAYYDSTDADQFYFNIWGGEDIHIGLYDDTDVIAEASHKTVARMAAQLSITESTKVLDIGAGYGGAARHLARAFGCTVHCLNLSRTQNATNEQLNREQGLDHLVKVIHGSFEDIPEPDGSFDVVWSQDAILHSGNRKLVLSEVDRVLKPGGDFVFTDPMQADDCPEGVLQPVYDRIHLESLGSFAFYRDALRELGFEEKAVLDLTPQLGRHYGRVAEELERNYDEMAAKSSRDYLDRMLVGLGNWVSAQRKGYLAWGIMHFTKPPA